MVLTWWNQKTKCEKDCTICPCFVFIPPSFHAHPFSISVCVCVYVPVSPCLPGFPCFFFLSSSLYLPLFSLVLRTCRWHGAWPDKVIPQCRGLPGRDSLDTVSPLLARCGLQGEGRPELEWGEEKEKWGRGRGRRKETWHTALTRGWNQCSNANRVPVYSACLMRLRGQGTF